MTHFNPIVRALLSVSDKTGIIEFARALHARGIELLSTGGTAKLLAEHGLPVTEAAKVTGFPEMLDGRVKTLHPAIHGGILARRGKLCHMQALADQGIAPIDMVVVNLYPFAQATAAAQVRLEDAVENIDIGGPAMVRASAKNYTDVTIVVDPADYPLVLNDLAQNQGSTQLATRYQLAAKAFAHTAAYDAAIAAFLSSTENTEGNLEDTPNRNPYPTVLGLQLHKVQDLRYGENPHQSAAFYREANAPEGALANYKQCQGKELSFNNIADADAAWECVKSFETPACVIVKHANPCGVAVAESIEAAYHKALSTDPTSAFGGIIAFNRTVDAATATAVCKQFVEVLIAPQFSAEALVVLSAKQNVRVLEIPLQTGVPSHDYKRVGGGMLVQSADVHSIADHLMTNPTPQSELRVVTTLQPTQAQWQDLLFAWRCAKFVKSNAIVFCKDGMTLGVGAGQMSRVDSARIASIKAENAKLSLQGSAVASDAFFPFRDGLDVVIDAGANCVIQPGGSVRDNEVIDAANERGVVMVLTGIRHFRH